MRTVQYSMLALLGWFTLSLLIESNRVPRFGADYFVGLALDLLPVVVACILFAGLWRKSQRLHTLPIGIKALISFAVPFAAGLPIVVDQPTGLGGQIYFFRHWDFYRNIFSWNPQWIVFSIHLLATTLVAATLFWTTRRLEIRRPEPGHGKSAVRVLGIVVVISLACANLFMARQYLLVMAPSRPDYTVQSELAMGTCIPAFDLIDTDGGEIRHEPHADDVLLVNFFAPWCLPCCQEMPHLQSIWDENRNNPHFSMVVVALWEPNDAVVNFKRDNEYTMPFAIDADGSVYKLFGLDGAIPHTCLLRNGAIRLSIAGFDENRLDELKQQLTATLNQPLSR